MKWTCERCGLQVDDKRVPNDCQNVKGQTHEWEETWYVLEKKEAEKERQDKEEWRIFLNTPDGKEWQNELKKIKATIQETVESVQMQYIQVLEKEKANYNKGLTDIKIKTEEYNKKVERYNEIKNENVLLNGNIITVKKGILNRLIIAGVGFWAILIIFSNLPIAVIFLLSVIIIPVIFRMQRNNINNKKINANNINLNNLSNELANDNKELFQNDNNLNELWKNYLKEINKKYEAGIENIIQKSKQIIQENNQKYKVNKGLLYDDNLMYDKYNPDDYKFRKMYIKDNDFVREHNIA